MSKVWLNGDVHPSGSGLIDLDNRGLLIADGVFETLPVTAGWPLFLADHLERLRRGAQALALPFGWSDADILQAIRALAPGDGESFSVRVTHTRGAGPRGIALPEKNQQPVTFITTAPTGALAQTGAQAGAHAEALAPVSRSVMISNIRRNEGSPASRLKTLAYMDNMLARQEAAGAGADEAVMLNNRGDIACATIANIFLIDDAGRLRTPDISAGALPGITRSKVIDIARSEGIECLVTPVPREGLDGSEFFLTNSLIGLQPAHLAGAPAKTPSSLFRILQKRYIELAEADRQAGRVE